MLHCPSPCLLQMTLFLLSLWYPGSLLSSVADAASAHILSPLSFSSLSTVLLHVSCRWPCFLFPCGTQDPFYHLLLILPPPTFLVLCPASPSPLSFFMSPPQVLNLINYSCGWPCFLFPPLLLILPLPTFLVLCPSAPSPLSFFMSPPQVLNLINYSYRWPCFLSPCGT